MKEPTDFLGQPIEIGDSVIYAIWNSSSCSIGAGTVIDIVGKRNVFGADAKIRCNISKKIIQRNHKKIIIIQALKEVSPEFFI